MLIINKTKKEKNYKMPPVPMYEHKILTIAWLKKQRMESELINIKSISIQVKDIRQMIYSKSFRMVSLYAKCQRGLQYTNQNDEDYITITKSKKGSKKESVNKDLIYDIITSDWIINAEEIANKSVEEIETELQSLESEIEKLNVKLTKNAFSKTDITSRINLLTYKKACLIDYLNEKNREDNKLKKLTKK